MSPWWCNKSTRGLRKSGSNKKKEISVKKRIKKVRR